MVQALRDAGRWDEALAMANNAIQLLTPHLDTAPEDWRGTVGALEAEKALVHARRGRHGDAWRHWENADRIAAMLGPRYRHVQSSFSTAIMSAHATTLGVELQRAGEALRSAESFDPATIASVPRRSRHLIEVARAYHQRGDRTATLALLERSETTASETIRYNGHARDMMRGMLKQPPAGEKQRVRRLGHQLGIDE